MSRLKLNKSAPNSLAERIGFLIYRLSHSSHSYPSFTATPKMLDIQAEPHEAKTVGLFYRLGSPFSKLTDKFFNALESIYPFTSEYTVRGSTMDIIAKIKNTLGKLFTPVLKLTESIYLSLFHDVRVKQQNVLPKIIEAARKKGLILFVVIMGYLLAQGVINLSPRHIVVFTLLPVGIAIICMKPKIGIIAYLFFTGAVLEKVIWNFPTSIFGVKMRFGTPILLAAMLSWVIDRVRKGEKFKGIYDSTNTLIIIYWGVLTLSFAFTCHSYLSDKPGWFYMALLNYNAFSNCLVLFFSMLFLIGDDKKEYFHMLYGIVAVYAFFAYKVIRKASYYGFGTDYTVTAGIQGQMGDNNELAACLNMVIPLSYALFLCAKTKTKKAVFLGVFVMAITAVIYTRSRGGLIGLLVVIPLLFFKLMIFNTKNKLIPIAFATVLFFSGYGFFHEKINTRLESIGNWKEDQSARNRIISVIAGWEMMKKSPIVGFGTFINIKPIQFCPDEMEIRTGFGDDDILVLQKPDNEFVIHNAYAALGAQYGIPALILFLWLILHSIKKLRRIRKDFPHNKENDWIHYLSHAFELSIIVYAITGLFLNNPNQVFIYIIYAMTSSLCYLVRKPTKKLDVGLSFLGIILFGLWLYLTVYYQA